MLLLPEGHAKNVKIIYEKPNVNAPVGCVRLPNLFLVIISFAHGYAPFFAPYFDRCCLRPSTPVVSNTPRTMWYLTPGRSFTLPPRIRTTACSCKRCPSPGIYAVTSAPFMSRTRATFRKAEFGFFGVVVNTLTHTPRLKGDGELV